jgi:CPA1 family monovalent cation:H+ antiporter
VGIHHVGLGEISVPTIDFLRRIDFSTVVMDGMLSLLLFAGALHVDISQLRSYKWPIFGLSVVGTLLSTVIVGVCTYYMLQVAGLSTSFWYCMVFGALISPTDPVAVQGVLKQYKAPDSLNVVIAGESLFNDGVSVVLFTILLGIATKGKPPSASEISWLIVHEVGGGLAFGLALGGLLYYMLRSIDKYSIEVLLTLAGVLGGYLLATKLHVSGPLAMVIAGLVIGNQGRDTAMSDATRHHVDLFWELIDEILNAVLFVLLGLEIILLSLSWRLFGLSVAVIAITTFARWLTVGLPISLTEQKMQLPDGAWKVLTWGGLRGGISVALALSLSAGTSRNVILALTYGVVIFSMLGQGLTIGRVIEKSVRTKIK